MAKKAFAATAFKTSSGQIFFTPFGVYGRAYPIRTDAEFQSLWRGVTRFALPAAAILLTMLTLWLGHSILSSRVQWELAATVTAAFIVWMVTFVAWARMAAARLSAECEPEATNAASIQPASKPLRQPFSAIQPDVTILRRTGKEVLAHVLDAMRDKDSVHVESLMIALGSLAGFAAQIGLREAAKIADAEPPLIAMETKSGEMFFFGDALNALLAESPISILSIVLEAPLRQGIAVPDVREIFRHVTASIGSETFGIPRVALTQPTSKPIEIVRLLWPQTERILWQGCPPYGWAAAIAYAARYAACSTETMLDLGSAVSLVMESAIPMSKLDPRKIGATCG